MLLIGEVAERSGLATSAIRYYEELGLVEPVGRESSRRIFAESAVNRLVAIAAAREAGFSLEEIRSLLDSQKEGTDLWRLLVEAKIAEVRSRINRLRAIEVTLLDSLTCGCSAWDQCPIVVQEDGERIAVKEGVTADGL
jgi:DNA-binding transcriptional MerR regulator